MTIFDPTNPYPLLPISACASPSAKAHARAVDAWLGYRIDETEAVVRASRFAPELAAFETWAHLSPDVFQTSYLELRALLALTRLDDGARVVDLGAGYGRLAFVLAQVAPTARFIGIECVAARVLEAQRVFDAAGLNTAEMRQGDLTDPRFELPPAEVYFLYDCGTREDVDVLIARLEHLPARPMVIIGRGGRVQERLARSGKWSKMAPLEQAEAAVYRPVSHSHLA